MYCKLYQSSKKTICEARGFPRTRYWFRGGLLCLTLQWHGGRSTVLGPLTRSGGRVETLRPHENREPNREDTRSPDSTTTYTVPR